MEKVLRLGLQISIRVMARQTDVHIEGYLARPWQEDVCLEM